MTKEVVVSQVGHEAEISGYLSQLSSGKGLILDMGGLLPPSLRNDRRSINANTCISLKDAQTIDKVACNLAKNWYGNDVGPKYKGISVGDMIAYEVMQWFISAMKLAVIFSQLFCEKQIETLVISDDGSNNAQIITAIGDAYGLSVKRLVSSSNRSAPPYVSPGWRRALARVAQSCYERFHSGRNTLAKLEAKIKPGFDRPTGLRCVLFDPYVGYERLMPQLFGSACARVVIPYSHLRLMPKINYYQDIFSIPTGHFQLDICSAQGCHAGFTDILQLLKVELGKQRPPSEVPGIEVVWAPLCNAFHNYYAPLIRKACAEIETAELISRTHKIDATVLPYDEFGLYKALSLVGRRDGLLTIRYQHGVANRYSAFIPPSSETVIVWDDDARLFFQSIGVAENRLTVLQNPIVPVIDLMARQTDREQVRRALGIRDMQSMVLFAAQPFCGLSALDYREEVSKILVDILDVANSMPESKVIIKLHPNVASEEEAQKVENLITERGINNVSVVMTGDIHQLMLASDVVVAETSTCLWEATVLNRPAVSYVAREFTRQVYPYGPKSGVIRTDNPEELARVIKETIRRSARTAAVQFHAAAKVEDNFLNESDYYNDPRWELISLIPSGVRRLLDVGCGFGWLGQKVKATRPCFVVGIEISDYAAKSAEKVLDEVFVADVEQFSPPFNEKTFDCIIFGDILEHLRDPYDTLQRYMKFLSDDGFIITSIPNIGHYTILLSLIKGHWKYQDEGILDRKHVRFFTRKEIENLLMQSGLHPVKMLRNTGAGRIMKTANFFMCNRLADLITFQYITISKRRPMERC